MMDRKIFDFFLNEWTLKDMKDRCGHPEEVHGKYAVDVLVQDLKCILVIL